MKENSEKRDGSQDGATLTSGHVTESAPGAGNRFPQGDTVTLTCVDSVWMYANGDLSRSFNCTGMDTIDVVWSYCTSNYFFSILSYAMQVIRLHLLVI